MRVIKFFIQIFIFFGLFYYWFGGGMEKQAASTGQTIYNKVAEDAVAQYMIAARNGTKMDRCVHAGFVTAAFIQAKNEHDYKSWKAIQKTDCKAAGVPIE